MGYIIMKYQSLLNQLVTGWERTLERQEKREIELKSSGDRNDETIGLAVEMANDQLRHCIETLRVLMNDLSRIENHENTIAGMIHELTEPKNR